MDNKKEDDVNEEITAGEEIVLPGEAATMECSAENGSGVLPSEETVETGPDSFAETTLAGNTGKTRKTSKLKQKIHQITLESDIKYRGPLSYRALRILAWVFIVASQIGLLCSVAARMDGGFANKVGVLPDVLKAFSELITPMFLIASFATILNGTRKFSSLLLLYGSMSMLIFLIFALVYERYAIGLISGLTEMDRANSESMIRELLPLICPGGFFSFNIFFDLFLCSLFTFFIIYHPKKIFVGKKMLIFRAFAILPFSYEVASPVLKILASLGKISLHPLFFPLLTTKAPLTFLVFVALTFFIKTREAIYVKRGKTHEEYSAFLNTNFNSLHFSLFTSLILFIAAIIDLILAIILNVSLSAAIPSDSALLAMTTVEDIVSSWGIGSSVSLILAIPFVMLFSYTRNHKDTRFDIILPAIAIIILILVYLESGFQGAMYLPQMLKDMAGATGA